MEENIYFIIGFHFFSEDFRALLDFYLFFQLKPFQKKFEEKTMWLMGYIFKTGDYDQHSRF